MEIFFEALGTAWHITVEAAGVTTALQAELVAQTTTFENRFSRFKDSEATQFRQAKAGTYPISAELAELLTHAERLRQITSGVFDPAVGTLLEAAGYDAMYQLSVDAAAVEKWRLPVWSLTDGRVTIDGPVVFDLGGFGKGYWIDQLAFELQRRGYTHWLVEGGGDMVASTKPSGQGYRVALEYPGKPDTALGVLELRNNALAVSDTFRRRWGEWHHIVNATAKKPTANILGVAAVAPTALTADMMTSALALSDSNLYPEISAKLGGEYLVVTTAGEVLVSSAWPGEVFFD